MVQVDPLEDASVRRSACEGLAKQSVSGVFANWVLAIVILTTTSIARSHPSGAILAASWMALIGVGRIFVAKLFRRGYDSTPARWRQLFLGGLVLSSASWGLGGAVFVLASGAARDSWLMLMTLAGISAGGLTSLSADKTFLRVHVVCILTPIFLVGVFLPGTTADVVGFATIVPAFAAFLMIQGNYAYASFMEALATTRLLERRAIELEIAREASAEASRVKSEFLANMSHEIRTPMTAVIGYADLLLDPLLGPSERVNYLQTIRRNGEHLLAVINNVLDISKIEAGKLTVECIATSPSQVVVDVASLMRVHAAHKNLTFDIKYLGLIPETIQSDPTRLKQIVMNFVGNAVKFTESGGVRILVRCDEPSTPNPQLVVDVADTGIGMTDEQRQRLFQSFTQADASTTRRFGGSGLGLVISQRLAALLGGSVSVESALGRGSVFRLSLPTGSLREVPMIEGLAEAGIIDVPTPGQRHVPSLPPACKVLLAEDGVDNQLLITTYLVKAGATVKVVGDGQQAVEEATAAMASGRPYDVILMDMQMPTLDGYGATSKLRFLKYDRPIVALTAHAMAGDRERCEKAGCDDYLTKPVDRSQLVSVIARFARNSPVPLVSTLVDDDDMREIIHQFVRDLPERSSAILRASHAEDVVTLKRLAHQLSGAAGGYGFPRITDAARTVERALTQGDAIGSIQGQVEELAALCRRARAA